MLHTSLILKIKGSNTTYQPHNEPETCPIIGVDSDQNIESNDIRLFEQLTSQSICFHNQQYNFNKILSQNSTLLELQSLVNPKNSICCIFMGPIGGGKTSTLRNILNQSFGDIECERYITAFRIHDKSSVYDVLEHSSKSKKSTISSISIERRLKKVKLSKNNSSKVLSHIFDYKESDVIGEHFLFINLHYPKSNKKITYIDFMENDTPSSTSCTFVSQNRASIIRLLSKNSTNSAVNSSTFITSYISKSNYLSIKSILHLDQLGNFEVTKASLQKIESLLKNVELNAKTDSIAPTTFRLKSPTSLPKYSRPKQASSSPTKSSSNLLRFPSSKVKDDGNGSPIKLVTSTPRKAAQKFNMKTPINNTNIDVQNPSANVFQTPFGFSESAHEGDKTLANLLSSSISSSGTNVQANKTSNNIVLGSFNGSDSNEETLAKFFSSPVASSPINGGNSNKARDPKTRMKVPLSISPMNSFSGKSKVNELNNNFYQTQIIELKSTVDSLKMENENLKNEHVTLIENLTNEKLEFNDHLINFKENSDFATEESNVIKTNNKILIEKKNQSCNSSKTTKEKEVSHNKCQNILNLKLNNESILQENKYLKSHNIEVDTELQDFKKRLKETEITNSLYKHEYERIKDENEKFKKLIKNLEETNNLNNLKLKEIKDELVEQSKYFDKLVEEKDLSISELSMENQNYESLVNEHSSTLSNQQETIIKLSGDNMHLNEKLDSKVVDYDTILEQFKSLKISSTREVDELKQTIHAKDVMIKSQSDLIELKDKIIEKQEQNNNLKSKNQEPLDETKSRLSYQIEGYNELHEQLRQYELRLEKLNSKYKESISLTEDLSKENKVITEKYTSSLKENESLREENRFIRDKIKSSDKELSNIKTKLKGNVLQRAENFEKLSSESKISPQKFSPSKTNYNDKIDLVNLKFNSSKDIYYENIDSPIMLQKLDKNILAETTNTNSKIVIDKVLKRKASSYEHKGKLKKSDTCEE